MVGGRGTHGRGNAGHSSRWVASNVVHPVGCPASCTCFWGHGPPILCGWWHPCCTIFYGRGYARFWRSNGASDVPIWGVVPVWASGGFRFPRIPAPGVVWDGLGFRGPLSFPLVDGDPPAHSRASANGRTCQHPSGGGSRGVGSGVWSSGPSFAMQRHRLARSFWWEERHWFEG